MRGIVCGFGQVGYRISLLALRSGHDVTIVSSTARPEWQEEIASLGAKFVHGDARDERLLIKAGLPHADWLISATANDLTNIEVVLDAKRLCPQVNTVARVFDQNLAPRLESTFGIDRVLAMSRLAAPAFISAAFGDQLIAWFGWGDERIGVIQLVITEEHKFAGRTLGDLQRETGLSTLLFTREGGVPDLKPDHEITLKAGDTFKLVGPESAIRAAATLPAGLTRGIEPPRRKFPKGRSGPRLRIWRNAPRDLKLLLFGLVLLILLSTLVFMLGLRLSVVDAFYFVVSTVTTTGYGDFSARYASDGMKLFVCLVMLLGSATFATLYSIITNALVAARIRELKTGFPIPESRHVIVVGLGNVGFRTCEELLRIGVEVVAIDQDPDAKFASTLRTQMAVIVGDARESEVLEMANLSTAAAIIVTTSDDAVNLSIGLIAKEQAVDQRIVLRLFDDRFARKVQSTVAFSGAFSAPGIAAPAFLGRACYPASVASFVVEGVFVTLFIRGPSELDESRRRGESIVRVRPDGAAITALAQTLRPESEAAALTT
jgi:Trk K+ transport system NAD-binding subunit